MAPGARRLDSLTGLRALAAFIVFCHHFAPGPRWVWWQGRVAVSFFFVLSGFVLMWGFRRRGTAADFLRRRFARIYPAYLVAWVLGAGIMIQLGAHVSLGQGIVGGALLQSWVPAAHWYYAGNGVSWSLSTEAFFYLSFPLWALALAGAGARTQRRTAVAMVVAVFVVAAVGQVTYTNGDLMGDPDGVGVWLVRIFPLTRLPEFVLGACLALELKRGTRVPVSLNQALGITAVAYLACGLVVTQFSTAALTLVPFCLLIAAAASADRSGAQTVFATRPMVYLGEISFCFYLVHQVVIRGADDVLGGVIPRPGLLPLAVLAAAALHHGVEVPWERRLRSGHPALRQRRAAATT